MLAPLGPMALWEIVALATTHRWDRSVWATGYVYSPKLIYVGGAVFGWCGFLVFSFMGRLDGRHMLVFALGLGFVLGALAALFAANSQLAIIMFFMFALCLPTAVAFWGLAGLPWRAVVAKAV